MKLLNIAIFSIKRQKSRKFFLVVALSLGCAIVVSLFTFIGSQKNKIEEQFDEYGANIIVMPKSDNFLLTYGGINVSPITANLEMMSQDDIKKIMTIPENNLLRAVSPKIIEVITINKDIKHNVLFLGVFFEEERKIKSWWELQGRYPMIDNEVIIGSEVASKLNLSIGTSFDIKGKKIIITGILSPTGSQDDSIIFGDLLFLKKNFNKKNNISLIEISAHCARCPIDEIIGHIRDALPHVSVKGVRQIMKQKMNMLEQFNKFSLTITFIIIVIGAILIFNSMMGSIAERTKEIGIFRALGYKKKHIYNIILSESIIIAIFSGLIGIIIGLLSSYFMLPMLADIDLALVKSNFSMLVITLFSVLILSVTASLYPAYKAAEIDPVIALSSI